MIEVRNIQHISLKLEPLKKLIYKYARSLKLKKDVVVVFDKRVTKQAGYHHLDLETQKHIIQIAPKCEGYNDKVVLKYALISYILHELKHAQQREVHGYQYWNNSREFAFIPQIQHTALSQYYSKCEAEARTYQNKHMHNAVDFYDKQVIS